MQTPYQTYKERRQRQAGLDYEDYVAKTLAGDGWKVMRGNAYSEHDHGIDLIATKGGTRRYIQCKGWRSERFIHEDVVSHLYGSVAAIEGTDNLNGVEIYLYSPAQLDSYTTKEVGKLNIHFEHLLFPFRHRAAHRFYRRRYRHHYHA